MKNELQKHKKSDGFKWFCTLLAVLMLAVAVTAAITQGFKNWNPYGWFDKKEEQPLPEENGGGPVIDESGNEMNGGEVHEMPKQMTFRSVAALDGESAYDSVTLHATVKPDDAEDKRITWVAIFKNPESAWATGKTVTDYVTVTPQSEGSSVATVKCLQPFGEQIEILAGLTWLSDKFYGMSIEEIYKASEFESALGSMIVGCSVDFAKRVTSASVDLSGGEKSMTVDAFANSVTCPFSLYFEFGGEDTYSFTYTDFTIEDTFSVTLSVDVNTEVFATAKTATGDEFFTAGSVGIGLVENYLSGAFVVSDSASVKDTFDSLNLYSRWLGENLDSGLFYFNFGIKGKYTNYTKHVPIHFMADSLEIIPTEIILDDTDLII